MTKPWGRVRSLAGAIADVVDDELDRFYYLREDLGVWWRGLRIVRYYNFYRTGKW